MNQTDTEATMSNILSLHDALPIFRRVSTWGTLVTVPSSVQAEDSTNARGTPLSSRNWSASISLARACSSDRKSTRLNSSHSQTSYAVFCLKKKSNAASDRSPYDYD